MSMKNALQIVDLLFKDMDPAQITDEAVDRVLESLYRKPVKRAEFKAKMVERYGEDIFVNRGKRMAAASHGKGEDWKKERAEKAAKKRWEGKES